MWLVSRFDIGERDNGPRRSSNPLKNELLSRFGDQKVSFCGRDVKSVVYKENLLPFFGCKFKNVKICKLD